MKTRIRAAINCLRGRPTAYDITVRGGGLEARPGVYIARVRCLPARPAAAVTLRMPQR